MQNTSNNDKESVPALSPSGIAERIEHILSIYPRLSHSMLQVGLGMSIPSRLWRPVLDEMAVENRVKITSQYLLAPSGRNINYTVISLVE